ncbi:MAG: Dabb family protein [Flavisolibacter sp.]|nr:Dabb family protein [Flavisolibacter sp.]
MAKQNRRTFMSNAGKAVAATGIGLSSNTFPMAEKNEFIHHVYFWLKNSNSAEDKQKLIEGLKQLSKVKTIRSFHIGQPADTNRDVIERTYALSWLLFFKNAADQESYQTDPIHLDFVKNYSHLWSKVIVYDSVGI